MPVVLGLSGGLVGPVVAVFGWGWCCLGLGVFVAAVDLGAELVCVVSLGFRVFCRLWTLLRFLHVGRVDFVPVSVRTS